MCCQAAGFSKPGFLIYIVETKWVQRSLIIHDLYIEIILSQVIKVKKKNIQTNETPRLSNSLCPQVCSHLVLGGGHSDQLFKLVAKAVGYFHPGDALGLIDVDVHLQEVNGTVALWWGIGHLHMLGHTNLI